MTPRYPWRRSVIRETVVPIFWLLAVSVPIIAVLGTWIARSEAPSPGQLFADEHAADICIMLDHKPTLSGVSEVLGILASDGLSRREADIALVASVVFTCPIHADLVQKAMDRRPAERGVIT